MAWYYKGRKYWYHNGKRYSSRAKFKRTNLIEPVPSKRRYGNKNRILLNSSYDKGFYAELYLSVENGKYYLEDYNQRRNLNERTIKKEISKEKAKGYYINPKYIKEARKETAKVNKEINKEKKFWGI